MMRATVPALAAIVLAFGLSACSSEVYPGYAEHLEEKAAEDAELNDIREQEAMADQYAAEGMWEPSWAAGWTCSYEPTMNEDWHDDAVCRNGTDSHRPYLREWDDFVTEAELMESAGEYAAELNAG
jgi:hypothetical protein